MRRQPPAVSRRPGARSAGWLVLGVVFLLTAGVNTFLVIDRQVWWPVIVGIAALALAVLSLRRAVAGRRAAAAPFPPD